MATAAKQWVGQTVDGKFRLGDFVGANERSAVFLTDYQAPGVRKAAIKLVAADSPEAAGLLGRWHHAAELSHPHLIRILAMGRCEFNATPILYVVTEYADENLAVVLARRPLGPAEARGILGPVVDALSYIHSKGFVHTRIKPANIMAEEDLLKISSDGLCRIGESSGALPQRLASWERPNQADPALPSGVPPEFADIARHCLRRDPQLRWSIADIAARLNPNAAAAPKQILPTAQSGFDVRRYVLPVVVALLLPALILTAARMFLRHAPSHPSASVAPVTLAPVTAAQPAPTPATSPATPAKPKPEATKTQPVPAPAPPVAKSSPPVQPPPAPKAVVQTPPRLSTPAPPPVAAPAPAISSSATAGVTHGKFLQQDLPNAAQSARNTIRGTVRVTVKVQVDESGAVTQ